MPAKPPARKTGRRKVAVSARTSKRFLDALANGETINAAAFIAGNHKARFYEKRSREPEFAEAWDEAREQGTDHLEQLLANRIADGYEEEIRDGDGRLIRRHRKYYPPDLHLALKAHRPDRYRDGVPAQQTMQVQVGVIVEDRSATVDELFAVLRAANVPDVLGRPARPDLAGAAELLAAPVDG